MTDSFMSLYIKIKYVEMEANNTKLLSVTLKKMQFSVQI